MTAQYSIGVSTNRFELFDLGDEDPLELIQKQEQEKEAKKKAKLVEKDVKPKPTTPAVPKSKSEKVKSQNSGGGGGHDSHKVKDEPLKTVSRGDDRKSNTDFKGPRGGDRGGDHGGQGGGNYRGGDHEKENYRSREDQDRGRDMATDDGGFRKSDFGGRGGDRPRGGGRGGGSNAFRGRTFQRGGGGPGGRSFGGGEGGERGGERGGAGYRGKREFDRQSGSNRTGVKPMEKRNGSGNYNWGTVKDEWNAANEEELNSSNDKENWDTSNNDANASNGPEEWTGPADTNSQWNPDTSAKGDAPATAQPDPADPNAPQPPSGDNPENPDAPSDTGAPKEELTLDEWKAKKGPKAAPSYNLRKAGEGEDLTQWKKMYVLHKKKDGEDEEDEEYEYIEIPQRVGRQRHVLDIDIRYKDSRGGNVGRGRGRGRGGFRGPPREDRAAPGGGGPRGEPGGPTGGPGVREGGPGGPPHSGPHKEAPKVDDEHDFPSLS